MLVISQQNMKNKKFIFIIIKLESTSIIQLVKNKNHPSNRRYIR